MIITSIGTSPLMRLGLLEGFRKVGFETEYFPFRLWSQLDEETGKELLIKDFKKIKTDFLIHGGYAPKYFSILPEICKEKGVAFIYWAIEDPVGYNNTLFLAEKADFVFTTTQECVSEYAKKGIKATLLTFACNPDYHKMGKYSSKYDLDLALVASHYRWEARRKGYRTILDGAIESGKRLKVWGAGWDTDIGRKTLKNQGIFEGYLPNSHLPSLCASAKIVLGIQCDDSSFTQTSMRPYEVLGCHGFHLTQKTKATTKIFKDGEHLVTAGSKEEAIEKILYYLERPQERQRIARQGQDFVYRYHTYEQRVKEIMLPQMVR
ncbi:CgeB family protein [Halalkalibacterium halodurans]|uniref:CgeB family protein n=1 Tax=Halalkalibacterium halodurans TaxID=86665 RepID=UPI002AAA1043|nr:glycosyltransferase [Halalkalibacterium halodurans]MDY7223910.1 glycosyltransferase [Halalkalibacterium halodurans]MDY7243131.1 glycosyltransferase [Halalkalibacterium halodurans]